MDRRLPRYQSVDALQNALASTVFANTSSPKKASGRALGTLVELITFYMVRDWGLEGNLAIERGLPEYGNADIRHNVEFTLHAASRVAEIPVVRANRSLTGRELLHCMTAAEIDSSRATLRPTSKLLGAGLLRHACIFAEEDDGFWVAYATGGSQHFSISHLRTAPFAMFECKRVGIEEGMKKGPQTIEKAKQGAYVARSVSGLQRVPRRDGTVAALVEEVDGRLTTHPDYYGFLRHAIDSDDAASLANVVLTVGVVSNHGNWFTAGTQNKEMRVLAQSYDWLLFLTDPALAEFIEDVLQGSKAQFAATRAAFTASFGRASGATRFTKVTIDAEADRELTDYFRAERPWARWFNVVTPTSPIEELQADLLRLRAIHQST